MEYKPTPAKKIKREPLSQNENEKIPVKPPIIKNELIFTSEDEGDELPVANPDEPKNYRRIRILDDSDDSQSNEKTEKGQSNPPKSSKPISSDEDDEYVPLPTPYESKEVATASEKSASSGQTSSESSSPEVPQSKTTRKRRILTRSARNRLMQERSTAKNARSSRKPLDEASSSEFETGSLDGFVASDGSSTQDGSETEKSLTNLNKVKKQTVTKKKSKIKSDMIQSTCSKKNRKNEKNSSEEGSSSSSVEFFEIKVPKSSSKRKQSSPEPEKTDNSSENDISKKKSTTQKYRLKDQRNSQRSTKANSNRSSDSKSESESDSSSSESESDDLVKKPPKTDLPNAVTSELRKFLPTGYKVSYKRAQRSNQRKTSTGGFVQDPPDNLGYGDSDDSFIDNNADNNNYGNLESSSSSDEEVVPEDEAILDLDSDNFDELTSSGNSDKVSEVSISEVSSSESLKVHRKKSKSESDDCEAHIVTIGRETRYDVIKDKCLLCQNLGSTDFRNRDEHTTAKTWCKCSCCKVLSNRMENYDRVCCKEIEKVAKFMLKEKNISCVTKHPCFENDVLNYKGYLNSMESKLHGPAKKKMIRREIAAFNTCTDTEKVQKCKNSFIRWIFGRLGSENRMVVPACVMRRIRKKHAPNDGPLSFNPFKPKKTCEYSVHCRKAMYHL